MLEYFLSNDTWDRDEPIAAEKVISSGRFTMGEYVKKFEVEFAKKFSVKYAVMSNSGSSANLLAIAALVYSGRLNKGDEVLVPAVSWSTTFFPLAQMGLKLRFVDIDLHTLNIDVKQIENAITEHTKALFVVNLLGNPNYYKEILEICDAKNLLLIEDNCESLGAEYEGKMAGSFGVLGTFSTFYSHHICTMEGGVTVTDDEELYHYLLAIRAHGWTRNLPASSTIYEKNTDDFYESYNFIVPGFNLRPLEIEAAIGLEQLKKTDNLIKMRRENANDFKQIFKFSHDFSIQLEIGKSSWFGFAILLQNSKVGQRDRIVRGLKANSIEVRPIVAGNFTKNKALDYIDYSISGTLKNADFIHDNGFFVGNHSVSIKDKLEYLDEILKKV